MANLGLGCAPIAGLYADVGDDQATATVHAALARGWRLFDTAPLYGHGLSELRLGRALRGVPRGDFEVQTKVGRLLVPGEERSIFAGTPPVHPVFDFTADGVRRSLEASLERLQLDRVDSLLLHDPDDHWQQAIDEAYPAIEQMRAEGVVGRIGAGMNQSAMLTRFARETDMDVFLVAGELTLLDDGAVEDLVPAVVERGKAIIAAGVFNSGVLAGGDTFFYGEVPEWVRAKVQALQQVCDRFDVPLAAAAIQYPSRRAAVEMVVVGARSPGEVDENERLAGLALPPELWQELGFAGLVRS